MQLLEMDIPMVIALNMMDEVTGNAGSIDINKMENLIGVPVVPISAEKIRVLMNWYVMLYILQNIRKDPEGRTFAEKMNLGELFTAVFMQSVILLKIMHKMREFRSALQLQN